MGFYIQPEYSLDETDCEALADKINDMLTQDKIQEAKDVLSTDGIELSIDDLKLLKEALFGVPSVDQDVDEQEFDWGDRDDDEL